MAGGTTAQFSGPGHTYFDQVNLNGSVRSPAPSKLNPPNAISLMLIISCSTALPDRLPGLPVLVDYRPG